MTALLNSIIICKQHIKALSCVAAEFNQKSKLFHFFNKMHVLTVYRAYFHTSKYTVYQSGHYIIGWLLNMCTSLNTDGRFINKTLTMNIGNTDEVCDLLNLKDEKVHV